MARKFERAARKWAMKELASLGVNLPVNAAYMDVAVEAIKHARELTGRPAIVDGVHPEALLAEFYVSHQVRTSRLAG